MIDERQQQLASLYVLDRLSGSERASFEAELVKDSALQDLVRNLRASASPAASSTPPPLRPVQHSTSFPPARYLPWAIAASIAIACAWIGQLYLALQTENALLHDQQALADLELRAARQLAEAEHLVSKRQWQDANQQIADLTTQLQARGDLARFKVATLAAPEASSPGPLAIVVWNSLAQEGLLLVANLPALPPDKIYQLWVFDPAHPDPIAAGVVSVDPATRAARLDFRPQNRVDNASSFAVSIEQKGGISQRPGPVVLAGE